MGLSQMYVDWSDACRIPSEMGTIVLVRPLGRLLISIDSKMRESVSVVVHKVPKWSDQQSTYLASSQSELLSLQGGAR